MIFEWETDEERVRRHMSIPPKRKLEWLYEMHQLTLKTSSKRSLRLRQKMKEDRSLGKSFKIK